MTALVVITILSLLVATGAIGFAWVCNRSCEVIVDRMSETARREADEHDSEMGKLNSDYADLVKQLADAERRARRRARRTDGAEVPQS